MTLKILMKSLKKFKKVFMTRKRSTKNTMKWRTISRLTLKKEMRMPIKISMETAMKLLSMAKSKKSKKLTQEQKLKGRDSMRNIILFQLLTIEKTLVMSQSNRNQVIAKHKILSPKTSLMTSLMAMTSSMAMMVTKRPTMTTLYQMRAVQNYQVSGVPLLSKNS